MIIVSLLTLTAPIETEAVAIAPELGLTVYEARLKLTAPKPSILLQTADVERAARIADRLQKRGHGAVAFDTKDAIGNADMTEMDHYRLTANGVELDPGPRGQAEPMPYDDASALLMAMHRTSSSETHTETKKEFSSGRALLSGGLVRSRAVTRSVTTPTEDHEQVLYIYRRVGRPWILRERARASGPPVGDRSLRFVSQHRDAAPRELSARDLRRSIDAREAAGAFGDARDERAALAASNEQGDRSLGVRARELDHRNERRSLSNVGTRSFDLNPSRGCTLSGVCDRHRPRAAARVTFAAPSRAS